MYVVHTVRASGPGRGSARCGACSSTRRRNGATGDQSTSLRRGEVLSNAVLDAVGELLAVLLGTITLVALGSALVGREDLRSVRARIAQARGLASTVAVLAC